MTTATKRTQRRIARHHVGLISQLELTRRISAGQFDRYSRERVRAYLRDCCELVAYTLTGEPLYRRV